MEPKELQELLWEGLRAERVWSTLSSYRRNDSGRRKSRLLWTECLPAPHPPISYIEALSSKMIAFGTGAFGWLLGLDEDMMGDLRTLGSVPWKGREETPVCSLFLLFLETWGHREKVAVGKPGREPSPDTGYAGTVTLTSSLQNSETINVYSSP